MLALATPAITTAAPIHWTTHKITNDVTEISTAGTVHDARTGRAGNNNVTVNGVSQYAIGTFVANATNQAFNVRTVTNIQTTPTMTNGDHYSCGWQIRDLGVAADVDAGNTTVSASPASVPSNDATTSTITVTVRDDESNPLPGRSVSLVGSTGNATIEPAVAFSNANGEAIFTVRSAVAGTEVFTATADAVEITQTARSTSPPPSHPTKPQVASSSHA